jgi:diguanylate cyclase (GGDEF)-like protein
MMGRERIDDALAKLRKEIEDVVRVEQMTDQLTGLSNNVALSEWLQRAIEDNATFWCAMIEVDYFKRVNDKHGYANADLLLKKIGVRLQLVEDYMGTVLAVRAHGDEFFIAGLLGADPIEALNRVREEIAAIRIPVESSQSMACTVSVGWVASTDAGEEVVVTASEVMRMVESAVAAAKLRGRNCVVRYDPSMKKQLRNSVRVDCPRCGSSFVVDVPVDDTHKDKLFCPNCGERMARPC